MNSGTDFEIMEGRVVSFLRVSSGPRGEASGECQIHKYAVKALWICGSSKGKEISWKEMPQLHEKASTADPRRGSWPPSLRSARFPATWLETSVDSGPLPT